MSSKHENRQSDWQFYLSPAEAWEAMLDACRRAQKSIIMEQYIFENDDIGQKFFRVFIDRTKQGVDVKLMFDKVGSSSFRFSSLCEQLEKSGCRLLFYNSPRLIDIFKPQRFFPRTHIKALVVDRSVLFIGGVCIAQRMEKWRDTNIRIEGPVVKTAANALMHNRKRQAPKRQPKPAARKQFAYIQSDPRFFNHPIYRADLEAIGNAKKFIYISQAYFVPPRRLRRFLVRAARRGVEIIILVPEYSDVPIADWAFLSNARKMLRAGMRLYQYQPTMLHNKIMMVDGNWGMVGSSNMDPLSFFHNREANIIVRDKQVLERMKNDFLDDLKKSKKLTSERVKKIPLWKRAAARLARFLRPFL